MDKVIITIAREYGSGGKTIGQMLAKELGINCYDREIMRMASDDSGINEKLFAKADEKLKNSPIFRISQNIYKGELLPPESDDFVSNDNLFNYQAKVIKELAREESCVIIGRCADFVLKERDDVLTLFIHASGDFCLKMAMDRLCTDAKETEKFIEKTDRYRGEYYRYYTGHEWSDARNYDLCIDTSDMGFEKAVELIKAYLKIRFDYS